MQENKRMAPVWETLLIAAVFVLLAFGSRLFFVPALILPVPLAYLFVRRGLAAGGAGCVLAAAVCVLMLPGAGVGVAIVALTAGAGSGIAIAKRLPAYETLVLCCASFLLGCLLLEAYSCLFFGADIVSRLWGYFQEKLAAAPEYNVLAYFLLTVQQAAAGNAEAAQMLFAQYDAIVAYVNRPESLEALKSVVSTAVPAFAVEYASAGGFLGFLLTRGLAKKAGTQVTAIPPFSRFALPRKIGYGMVGVYLATLVLQMAGVMKLYVVCLMLELLLGVVFSIQGLAFVWFLWSRRIKSRGGKAAAMILTLAFVGWMLPYVGVMDAILRIRERVPGSGQS